MSSKLGCST